MIKSRARESSLCLYHHKECGGGCGGGAGGGWVVCWTLIIAAAPQLESRDTRWPDCNAAWPSYTTLVHTLAPGYKWQWWYLFVSVRWLLAAGCGWEKTLPTAVFGHPNPGQSAGVLSRSIRPLHSHSSDVGVAMLWWWSTQHCCCGELESTAVAMLLLAPRWWWW